MGKYRPKCPNCKEQPVWTRHPGWRECNLCGTGVEIKRRKSVKRDARVAQFEATLKRLFQT